MRYKLPLSLILLSTICSGVPEYYGTGRSVRALGMGGAFYSLSDDEYALFYNPAGLSLYRAGGQFLPVNATGYLSSGGLSHISTIQNATKGTSDVSVVVDRLSALSGKVISGGGGLFPCYVGRGFAVGALVGDVKGNLAVLGTALDTTLEMTAISDSGLLIGMGGNYLARGLHLGLNSKFLVRAGGFKRFAVTDFAANEAIHLTAAELGGVGFGIDFDLGAQYELAKPLFGSRQGFSLVVSNLLASHFTMATLEGGAPPGLVRSVSLGTYFILNGGAVFQRFAFRLDLAELPLGGETDLDRGARSGNLFKHVNLGLEVPVKGWLFLRTGVHQGAITGGLGLAFGLVRLDLATYAEELSTGIDRLASRRYAIRLAFGAIGSPKTSY